MDEPRPSAVATSRDDAHGRLPAGLVPYLLASPAGAAADIEQVPAGLGLPPLQRFDPFRLEAAPLTARVHRLQACATAAGGRTLERWVLYDCAEVPGAVFGFAAPAREAPAGVRKMLEVEPDDAGFVPLSMLVLMPMISRGTWQVFGLHAIDEAAPDEALADLRRLTLDAGLALLERATVYGVSSWGSTELVLHARYAPLELLSAWTPAHAPVAAATYRFDVVTDRAMAAFSGRPGVGAAPGEHEHADCSDESVLRDLQGRIEAGRRLEIIGAPRREGSRVLVPIREVSA